MFVLSMFNSWVDLLILSLDVLYHNMLFVVASYHDHKGKIEITLINRSYNC